MGMSSHVTGFKLPDEKWKKMKAIYDACKVANISPPQEVNEFFDYSPPRCWCTSRYSLYQIKRQ